MNEYLFPVLIFLGLGALAGILLLIASKVLFVQTDETVEKIKEVLPGANCGGCGFSGCEGYAKAVAEGRADVNLCKPGGADVMSAVSEIMGVAAGEFVREVAFVRCNGACGATDDKYTYTGSASCTAVERFYNGKGDCRFGCAGLGDCIKVCDNNAIRIENGVAVVNPVLCQGCGKCVKECPNHLIFMRKETSLVALRCSSHDIGKVTRTVCKNGCIACKMCEKKCPNGAIKVSDNRAEIDYSLCTSCGACADGCPMKCLVKIPACAE
ncbi:MAG: RnfABCDGE type electron transport complex subunit B [Eubacterium sp.]|nr:RnfABCDGE type electron transport complex subunit B [Eubacterium sp.]